MAGNKIKNNNMEYQAVLKCEDVQLALSMAELQLKYLFNILENRIEKDFDKALRGFTSIISSMKLIADFNESNGEWQNVLHSLQKVYADFSGTSQRKEFSAACMNILAPFLSYAALIPTTPYQWFGCFRYNYDENLKHIYLHFRNACCPESPFTSDRDRVKELCALADDIKKNALYPETIGCDSWLNELKIFQSFFPQEYSESFIISSPDSKSGYGWWGQFVGKDGKFNKLKAENFEKTMEFQYHRVIAKCSYESFVCHIINKSM